MMHAPRAEGAGSVHHVNKYDHLRQDNYDTLLPKNCIDIKRSYSFMYFAYLRGCSSVWLEYLPVTQGVAGSSPVNPAENMSARTKSSGIFVFSLIPGPATKSNKTDYSVKQ
jgi:hypothetical protein